MDLIIPNDNAVSANVRRALASAEDESGAAPTYYDPNGGFLPTWSNFWEATAAQFQRDNTLVSAGQSMANGSIRSIDGVTEASPEWDLMSSLSARDDDFLNRNRDAILDGAFDAAVTDEQIDEIARRLDDERKLIEAAEGSTLGAFVGSLGAAVADPISYIPVAGWAHRGTKVAKFIKFLMTTSAMTAAQEGILQSTQELRTLEETVMNVATSGIVGGGLGMFARAHGSKLNPNTAGSHLGADASRTSGYVERVLGEATDVEVSVDGRASARSTTGAAQVDTRIDDAAATTKDGTKSRAAGRAAAVVGKMQSFASISGRAWTYTSDTARGVLFRMMDNGGIYTADNAAGRATVADAESLKTIQLRASQQMFQKMDRDFRELRLELAKMSKGVGDKFRNARHLQRDWQELTRRIARRSSTDKVMETLRSRYGLQAAQAMEAAANRSAGHIHKANAHYEAELVRQGFIRDHKVLDNAVAQRDALRTERDTAKAAAKEAGAQVDEAAMADIRSRLEALDKVINAQRALPEAMGDMYGMAQIWNRGAIVRYRHKFRQFLLDVLANEPDEEWLETYWSAELEGRSMADIKTEDPELYRDILESWAGDERELLIEKTQAALDAAEARLKEATLDLNDVLRAERVVGRQINQLTVSAARKKRDAIAAKLEKMRAERTTKRKELAAIKKLIREEQRMAQQIAQAEGRALADAGTAARQMTLDRQTQMVEQPVGDVGEAEYTAATRAAFADARAQARTNAAGEAATGVPGDLADDAVSTLEKVIAGEQKAAVRAQATLDRLDAGPEATKVPDPELTTSRAAAEARAKATAEELGRTERRSLEDLKRTERELQAELDAQDAALERLDQKVARVDGALQSAESKLADAKSLRDQLKDARKESRADASEAMSDARKARRAAKAAAKREGLSATVDKVIDALARDGNVPAGATEGREAVSSRLKERVLKLSPEQVTAAEEALDDTGISFLETDLATLLRVGHESVAGELGLREALDIGPGRRFESWSAVTKEIQDDYASRIREADEAGDRALADRLDRELTQVLADAESLRNRLTGRVTDGAGPWMSWLSQKARQWNFIRFGSGMGISSLADVASIALRHEIRQMVKHAGPAWKAMRHMKESQLMALVHATDIGAASVMRASSSSARRFGDTDILEDHSRRFDNPLAAKFTNAVDRGLNGLTNATSIISMLPTITRFGKTWSAVMGSYRVRDLTATYDSISPDDMRDLASMGIGREEAAKIDAMMKKHGTTSSDGWWEPNIDSWDDLEAARVFELALVRDMQRSVITPGIGDTPRMLDGAMGKVFLQFMSFGFAFANRFVLPALQRGANARTAAALSMLLGMTVVSMGIRDLIRGKDPTERYTEEPASAVLEVIDRSGLLGYLSPYMSHAFKLAGIAESSRYERADTLGMVFGVNAGLLENAYGLGNALLALPSGAATTNEVYHHARAIAPFTLLIDGISTLTNHFD